MSLTLTLTEACPSAKSLVLGAGMAAGVYLLWRSRVVIAGYAVIGPYPALIVSVPARLAQRALVDTTKCEQNTVWFPTESLMEVEPRRQDNGHAKSGAIRDTARRTIDMALLSKGIEKYELSPYDQSSNIASYSPHFAPGDLHNNCRYDAITNKMAIVCIDVDYYVEDWTKLLGYPVPLIAFTFQPVEVSGVDGDSLYRIIDNRVEYEVSGGSHWSHQVWNWSSAGEFIKTRVPGFKSWLLSLVGIHRVQYHKVHVSRPWKDCPGRAIVWCLPVFTHWEFSWIQSEIKARELRRMIFRDPERPGWNVLTTLEDNCELRVSIGREGADSSITMKKQDLDVLLGLKSAQSVTSRLIGMGYKDQRVLATVGQFFEGNQKREIVSERVLRPHAVKVHWPSAFEADAPVTSMRSYASPLVTDENMVPQIKRWEALSGSLERRVEFVKNEKIPRSKMIHQYAKEYVSLVIPQNIAGTGVPYGIEDTVAELTKPSQVLGIKQIWETVDIAPRPLIEAFLKNEPCMKDGRIISSFPDMRYLLMFSRYTLKCRDEVFHSEEHRHWFLPGSTPKLIAECVRDYVSGIAEPAETDFSNFDGTVSRWMQRHVMNATYLRYFDPQFHSELQPYLDMLISCPGRAKRFGFRYEPGVGVKSGAPTTCDLNTIADGFVEYCALRKKYPDVPPNWAMKMLGPKFGDDGITRRELGSTINWVCDQLGLSVKIVPYIPGEGLTFLARVYPDPWNTTTSFQDPLRTFRKLHLTARDPNVPLATAATDRLEGYLATDRLTPIISDFCNRIIHLYDGEVALDTKRFTRKGQDKEKPYWLTVSGEDCEKGAWPQDEKDIPLMEDCISNRLGLPIESLRHWRTLINAMDQPWATISLDRELVESPYTNTLDEEGLPSSGAVNEREHLIMQNVQCQRANPETSRDPIDRRAGGGAEHQRPAPVRKRQRREGPSQFPRVPRGNGGQSHEGHESHTGQAVSSGVPERREERGETSKPAERNRAPTRRGGQMGGRTDRRRGDHRRAGNQHKGAH
nr:MAG: RNA-dependent RNA polymerase [Wufeng shrew nodavirus 8]